jgi:excisionase family DNA binding protein
MISTATGPLQLLSAKEVMARTSLGRSTVLALIRAGTIPSRHVGKRVLVDEQDLAEWWDGLA